MSISAGLAAFKLSFQLSPIILTHGIVENFPASMLPIIALTEGANFVDGLLSGASGLDDLDNFFANFVPLPGATMIANDIGRYPFANQAVAANAIISQPLDISMMMICPARNALGYAVKLATMQALRSALYYHNNAGGTYTIVTPSYLYTNCIMLRMEAAGSGETKQPQSEWRMDFTRPLLTLEEAQQSQNSLMSRLSSGTQITPDAGGAINWSGIPPTVGQPSSLAAGSIIPAASNTAGTGFAGIPGPVPVSVSALSP